MIWELNRYFLILASRQFLKTTLYDNLNTVCLLYQPDMTLVTVNELRWWIFRRKEAEMLLLTKAALIQAIKKAHFQCIVWYNDTVVNPNIP